MLRKDGVIPVAADSCSGERYDVSQAQEEPLRIGSTYYNMYIGIFVCQEDAAVQQEQHARQLNSVLPHSGSCHRWMQHNWPPGSHKQTQCARCLKLYRLVNPAMGAAYQQASAEVLLLSWHRRLKHTSLTGLDWRPFTI